MVAWFSGCLVRAVPTEDGILSWDDVRRQIRPLGPHCAPTGLIEIENTHNMAGGTVYPLRGHPRNLRRRPRARPEGPHGWRARLQRRRGAGRAGGRHRGPRGYGDVLPLEGAGRARRLHAGGPGEPHRQGAPVPQAPGRRHAPGGRAGGGRADRARGNAPAAGEDHANARFLAEGLARIPGIAHRPGRASPPTSWSSTSAARARRAARSARASKPAACCINPINDRLMRAVTHYDVDRAGCARALEAMALAVLS